MADMVQDPVWRMMIRPGDAGATEEHDGHVFYFCNESCHREFLADPHR